MPRTKNPTPEISTLPAHVNQSLEADAAKHGELLTQHEAQLKQLDAQLGLSVGYDRDKYIAAARDSLMVIGQRTFILGRIFLALKAHEKAAYKNALEEIGIAPRTAQQYSNATKVFLGTEDSRSLLTSHLSSSKLLELASEPPDALDDLAEGGDLHGHTLDDIRRMTVRELRDALRVERKAAKDQESVNNELSAKQAEKIRKLEINARVLRKAPFRERMDSALHELSVIALEAQSKLDQLRDGLQLLDEMHNEANEKYTADVLEVIDGHARSVMSLANDIVELAKA